MSINFEDKKSYTEFSHFFSDEQAWALAPTRPFSPLSLSGWILQQKLHLLALYHLRISTRKSRHFHDLRNETPLGNAGKAFPREFPVSWSKKMTYVAINSATTIGLIIGVKNRVSLSHPHFFFQLLLPRIVLAEHYSGSAPRPIGKWLRFFENYRGICLGGHEWARAELIRGYPGKLCPPLPGLLLKLAIRCPTGKR